MTLPETRQLSAAVRFTALLVLLAQLGLGAISHTERLPPDQASLAAAPDQAVVLHGHVCPACLLAHAPASPATPVAVAIVHSAGEITVFTRQSSARSTTTSTTQSRAPPVLSA